MKRIAVLLLAVIISLSLTACGADSACKDSPMESCTAEEYDENGFDMLECGETPAADPGTGLPGGEFQAQNQTRKLIKNVWLTVETLDFDSMISGVQQRIAELGGYIESSNVNGNSIYGGEYRHADITARVPAGKLDGFISEVDGMGNITYREENVDDVTLTYVDMEARMESLQTEYDRLMELLADAENLDSIIALEQRISEVRYEIESYKSQLRTYDNQVDYSTVSMIINEVERITPAEEKGVWERISTEFSENLYDVGQGLVNFFVWFVSSLPYLLLWAVVIGLIVLVVVLIVKGCSRSSARRAEKNAEKLRSHREQYEKRMTAQPQVHSKPESPAKPAQPKSGQAKPEAENREKTSGQEKK